jgi:predicted phage terminase large subunit-like protein
MRLTTDNLQAALASPQAALEAIKIVESERKLIDFIRNGWEALEPGNPFVTGWAVEATCDHLQAVTEGHIKRLLINVPPGCTKSMTTSVFWPAWEWGPRDIPSNRYILAAHEQSLAIRDNVRSRDLMLNEWYQRNWGEHVQFKSDVNAKTYYENKATGWRMASSVGSGLTGYRGDRLLLDDPHSIKKADSDAFREEVLRWFAETLPTRLNKPSESAIVVIMQRVHERDVAGLILAEELGYEHLMLPMEFEPERKCYSIVKPSYIKNSKKVKVSWDEHHKSWAPDEESTDEKYSVDPRTEDGELLWPARFSAKAVAELKKALRSWGGSYAEAGQLQQRPAPRGGGMFQKDDFNIVDKAPEGGRTIRGWDLAGTDNKTNKKAAYTVGCKMRLVNGGVYILDVDRKQASPSAVEKMILANTQRDGYGVVQDFPQDPGQAGKAQKFAIAKLLHGYTFLFSPETGSKEDRATPLAAQCESDNVYLVRADWNQSFINESSLFPNGQFKDQIDAASRAYSSLLRKRRRVIGVAPKVIKNH